HQAADIPVAGRIAALQADPADAAFVDAEQGNVVFPRPVDDQAADDMATPVEGAREAGIAIANRIETRTAKHRGPAFGTAGIADVDQREVAAQQPTPAPQAVDVAQHVGIVGTAVTPQGAQEDAAVEGEVGRVEPGQRGRHLYPVAAFQDEAPDVDRGVHGNVASGPEGQAAPGPADGRVEMDVVPGIQRQGVAAGPGDPVLDEDVAIAGPVTGTAGGAGAAGRGVGGLDGDVVAFQGRRQGGAGDVAARGGDGEVVGIDQPATSGTVGGAGGDSGAVGDPDVGGTGLDEAAVAAIGGTGVQGAVDDGAAGLHAAEQNDATLAVGDGPCLHD